MSYTEQESSVRIASEVYLLQIKTLQAAIKSRDDEIVKLKAQLEYERGLRSEAERKLIPVQSVESNKSRPRKKREVTVETNTYSDFKSDGKRKAHAVDSIRSYDDFKRIQDYFLEHGRIRDWAMWTIGVSLGLRVSDLLALRFKNVIEEDKKTIRQRIQIYEQKTGKLQNCLITNSVKNALKMYLEGIKWQFDYEGFLFPSAKTKGKMYEEHGWRILSAAGKAVGLPIIVGSHTMRKSFANIAACVDKSCIDMNSITKVQGLLNHSDQKSTMRYLGSYQAMFDRARNAVSEFVLGNTEINEIVAGNQYSIDDVMSRLDNLEASINNQKGGDED